MNKVSTRIVWTLLLAGVLLSVLGQEADDFRQFPPPECKEVGLPPRTLEWQDSVADSVVTVEWAYGEGMCSSVNDCFGISDPVDPPLEPQLMPVQIQPGVKVRFLASPNMDVDFHIQPFKVNEEDFRNCDFTSGFPVVTEASNLTIEVPDDFIKPGINYFITNTSNPLYSCKFGLRLNITVKTERCTGPGGDPGFCWTSGRCITQPLDTGFQCACCKGYTGQHCGDEDGCADEPCLHGGTCLDMKGTQSPQKFACVCPTGWHGALCEIEVENMCTHTPCDNNATCVGTKTDYQCLCPHGYSGHHCEVNLNDCHLGPCKHGVCVDKVGEYQCYCTPGYGGHNCDRKYSTCRSSPCLHNGYCVDKDGDDYDCHCQPGYSGINCVDKVDLCNQNPCHNATDCVDYGQNYQCVCKPGFSGAHCEIDVNECESTPCQNGGKCYDRPAGYKCLCPQGISGVHCEYTRTTLPKKQNGEDAYDSGFHPSHTQNLYIVAGTLAGALLLALAVLAGCYCRVHETYRVFYRKGSSKAGGYVRQRDESMSNRPDSTAPSTISSHSPTPRPDPNAIMEASRYGNNYHDNQTFRDNSYRDNMNAPLVASLKPKRV